MRSRNLVVECMTLAFAFAQMASAVTTFYVTTNGTGQGTSWSDATNSIQGAIDAIETGAANTVWVSNGVYEVGGLTNYPTGSLLTNRIVIYKAITVRSANNDPAHTIIKGNWNPVTPTGPAAVRCVYMSAGLLIGFTLTNGATLVGTAGDLDGHGGGVQGGSISNCVIVGNYATEGGGVANSISTRNCLIIGNTAKYGGGTRYGYTYESTIASNSVDQYGGGAYYGQLYHCTLLGNTATQRGGGAIYSTLYSCMVVNNYSWHGGGYYASILTEGSLYNCALIGNRAGGLGGGVNGSGPALYNCTIISNSAPTVGGVTGDNIYLYNSIVYFNTASVGSDSNWLSAGTVTFTNSCTAPAQAGWATGNITDDPMFVDKNTGNYHLCPNSPCVNAGLNGSWTTTCPTNLDLDWRQRVRYGTVDMGAYETIYEGTIYKFGI